MSNAKPLCDAPLSTRGEKILESAQQLFLQYGYENTSLEMIINQAGGSRRSIYSEFGNKQGLLKAVLKTHVANQIDILSSVNYQMEPKQALVDVCSRFVTGFLSDTIILLFRLVTQVVVTMPEIGELIFHEGPLKGTTPLADYLQYLNDENKVNIDDPYYAAQLLIEMAKGRLHMQAVLMPNTKISSEQITQHVEKAVDLFLKAYQTS